MKKKLIAALTSAAMVATMVPATAAAATTPAADPSPKAAVTQAVETSTSVDALIDAIGTTVEYTDACKGNIEKARTAYDSLSDFDKQAVTKIELLKNAEEAYGEYTKALKKAEVAIDAIGETVTAADYADPNGAVAKAKATLKPGDVTKVSVAGKTVGSAPNQITLSAEDIPLDTARGNKMKALTDSDALKDLIDMIDALAPIKEDNYTSQENDVKFARTAYDALSLDGQKDMVGNLGKLLACESKIKAYKDAVAMTEYLKDAEKPIGDKEGEISLADSKAAYQKALDAYNALSKTLQANASAAKDTIDNWAQAIAAFESNQSNATATEEVIRLIKALPSAANITLANEEQVKEARAAYDALTDDTAASAYESVLTAAEDQINSLIAKLSPKERAQRVVNLINKLPATTAEVTRDNTAAVKAAMAEYNVSGAQEFAWDENATESGVQNDWQKQVDSASLARLKAAIQVIVKAETVDTDKVAELAGMDGFADEMSVSDSTTLAKAKQAVEKAEKALSEANKYVQQEFAKATYDENRENLAATKQNIADYEGESSAENKAAAEEILKMMKALPAADKITEDTLSTDKQAVEAITSKLNAANEYVQKMVANDTKAMKFYNDAVQKIKLLEDKAMVPEIESAIAKLTILDTSKNPTEAEIDQAVAANKAARDQWSALDDQQKGMVTNVARLVKAETAATDSVNALLKTEIDKIGNTTAALSEAQIAQINAITALINKYTAAGVIADEKGASNYIDYTNAKNKLDAENAAKAEAEAAPVIAAINNLPANAADISKVQYATVVDLYKQYQNLSDAAKKEINADALKKLENAYKYAVVYVLDEAEITVGDVEYTGTDAEPLITVKDVNGTIVPATDYDVFYKNNGKVGTASVTIVATQGGKYVGTKTASFEIKAKDVSKLNIGTIAQQTYTGKALTPALVVKDGGKTLTSADYTVTYKNNTNAGTATVTITGKGNYTGTAIKNFTIAKASIAKASVSGIADLYYTGKARTQSKLKVAVSGKALSTANYSVAYKNNKNVGKATLTITGKGNYTGTITKTFIVKPRKVSNVKVTKGKKRVTVRYKKQAGASYQIYYKTSGSKAKTVKTAAVKKTIKKLKSGKRYTIKVRAYKKIGNKTYYGKYSAAKKVTVR